MADIEHTEATAGEIHSPYQWIVADAAARNALTADGSYDRYKICLQQDTGETWRMATTTPSVTWELVADAPGTSAAGITAHKAESSAHDSENIDYDNTASGLLAANIKAAIDELAGEKADNPMTTAEDLIVGGASGAPARLAVGTDGHVLTVTAGEVGWAAPTGGMTNPMTTQGDIITGGASGAPGRLALGTSGHFLKAGATDPEYAAIVANDVSNATTPGKALLTAADAAAQREALSVREQLTANRTYYVRTDGSDSNDGLANTAGGAFLTIQKAVDVAAGLDTGIYDVTIRCTGGFTDTCVFKSLTGAGKVIIRGDANDTTTMTVTTTSGNCFDFGDSGFAGTYQLEYMGLSTVTSGSCITGSGGGGAVLYGNINFGACAGSQLRPGQGQLVRAIGPYEISGSAGAHITAQDGGHAKAQSITVTLTGTPNISNFVVASRGSSCLFNGATFSGSATGRRYNVSLNSVVFTSGAGDTFLPGDVDGITATGGQYA